MEMSIPTAWKAERPLLASHSHTAWWTRNNKSIMTCGRNCGNREWCSEALHRLYCSIWFVLWRPKRACHSQLLFSNLFWWTWQFVPRSCALNSFLLHIRDLVGISSNMCRWTLYNLGALVLACLRYNVVIGYESRPFSEIQIFPKPVFWKLQVLLCTIKCMKHMIICLSLVIASLGVCRCMCNRQFHRYHINYCSW